MNKNGYFKCENCGHYQYTTEFGECEECGYEELTEITEEEYNANNVHDVIEALEKQKPKKVTHGATLSKYCTCPNCKNVIDSFEQFGGSQVRVKYNYCHFCGQKLDWK
ncbi:MULTISPECIES: hypothetical protein [Clostridium]|jgi:ribosomal protein L37E|uniref:hypothetical protein n=1 Tax=Clostridium TaxID=1485 RepID=UPI00242F1B2D|nr:hypothetical protein [Clostridium tyrobutyricum]